MQVKIHKVDQRSQEWFDLRRGKVGGSEADRLTTPAKMKTLIYDKAVEILTTPDFIDEPYVSEAMQRGIDLEPEVRYEYFLDKGIDFIEFGYITNSEYKYAGLSPDGLTSDLKTGCEIKCLNTKNHIEIIDTNQVPKDKMAQLSWYFFMIPELESIEFISYDDRFDVLPMHTITVKRSEAIDFEPLYKKFELELDKLLNKLRK